MKPSWLYPLLAAGVSACVNTVSTPAPQTPVPQAGSASAPYDLVIRNGRVLDGAGNPWIRADVAIKDGRFAKIGRVPERGAREIDAAGKYVSPGGFSLATGSPTTS